MDYQHYALLIRHPPAVRHRSWSCVSTSGMLFAIIATWVTKFKVIL